MQIGCCLTCATRKHATPPPNKRGKWITVNAEAEKDLILTSAAPDMMVFGFPGHQELEISSFPPRIFFFLILLSHSCVFLISCNFIIFFLHGLLALCHVQVRSEEAGKQDDILLLQPEGVDVTNVEVVGSSTSKIMVWTELFREWTIIVDWAPVLKKLNFNH